VGEILTGMLLDEAAGAHDLAPFRIGRLSPGGG
jgi:hypothetical protein